jgi:MFS family permease
MSSDHTTSATVESLGPTVETESRRRSLTATLIAIAAAKAVLTVAFSGRYGFHRDEFYYLASGQHLAWGYVDFPPVTPVLAFLDHLVFGTSLVGLRLLAALAGGIIVILGGLIARELGGGRFAQVVAAVLVAVSPLYLGANLLFQTVTFEQLWMALAFYLLVRLLRADNPRLWPLVGLVLGIGLLTKYTVLDIAFGLAAGIVLTRRRAHLRTPWPWLAAGIALVMLLPNMAWQVQHAWPTLEYLRNHQVDNRRDFPLPVFFGETILFIGPLVVPIFVAGAVFLFRQRPFRILGWTAAIALLALLLIGGKTYYFGPIYVLLYAAGAVALERFVARPRRGWATPALIAAIAIDLVPLPIGLPILPEAVMVQTNLWKVRSDYADMIGWPELVDVVAQAWNAIPSGDQAHTAIVTANYGEAGAIDFLGSSRGLPRALSGHLTYYFWKPAHVDASQVLAVGFDRTFLAAHFGSVVDDGTITNRDGIHNGEFGQKVYLCAQPLRSLDAMWSDFKTFR